MNGLLDIIKQFNKQKVLVVGDIMADKYLWGEVERVSPEAPVPVVHVKEETISPGGAANLANNVAALGATVHLAGLIGDDSAGTQLLEACLDSDISTKAIIVDKNKPTTQKIRVLGQNQQLIRLDYEDTTIISADAAQTLAKKVIELIAEADIVVLSDYQKGTLTKDLVRQIIKTAKDSNKVIIADTKSEDCTFYKGVDLITPNNKEASLMTATTGADQDSIVKMGERLVSELNCNVLITRASEGMSLFEKNGKVLHFPTQARDVFDVSGAGDTVVAAAALALASSATYEEAALIANKAAAIQVSKLATATVSQKELLKHFEQEHSKVKSPNEVQEIVEELKKANKKIVFTNGCFDLLHPGHVKYLKQASELGHVLIVGLNTDASVKRIKGKKRPIVAQEQRAEMLSFLDFVDFITFFKEDTPEKIIEMLKPAIFVKGGDYKLEDLPEAKIVQSYGGKVVLVPYIEGFSSSRIIHKIINTPS